jgi:GNAT superfamily N-acetyltransferase
VDEVLSFFRRQPVANAEPIFFHTRQLVKNEKRLAFLHPGFSPFCAFSSVFRSPGPLECTFRFSPDASGEEIASAIPRLFSRIGRSHSSMAFNAIPTGTVAIVESQCPGFEVVERNRTNLWVLTDADKFRAALPCDPVSPFRMKSLTSRDADMVLSSLSWGGDREAFRRFVDQQPALAVHLDGILVGWAGIYFETDVAIQMGFLYVIPEHRRRKIAAAITARLVQEILARGKTPFCHILEQNTASRNLVERFGFTMAGDFTWLVLRQAGVQVTRGRDGIGDDAEGPGAGDRPARDRNFSGFLASRRGRECLDEG